MSAHQASRRFSLPAETPWRARVGPASLYQLAGSRRFSCLPSDPLPRNTLSPNKRAHVPERQRKAAAGTGTNVCSCLRQAPGRQERGRGVNVARNMAMDPFEWFMAVPPVTRAYLSLWYVRRADVQ